jgi:hypothetical protein
VKLDDLNAAPATPPPAAPAAFGAVDTAVQPGNGGTEQVQSASISPNPTANVQVEVQQRADGGYDVKGNLGLRGEIVRSGGRWKFQGKFVFPHAGYSVGQVFVNVLRTMTVGIGAPQMSGEGDTVLINIPVTLPQKDAQFAQVVTEVPVAAEIDAPENAIFHVVVVSPQFH